jgi:hypothetical protein
MRHSFCVASLLIGLRRYLLGISMPPPYSLGTKSSWRSPVRIRPSIFKVEAESGGRLVFDAEDAEDAKYMAEAKAKGDTMIDIPDPLNDPQAVYEKAQAASAACKA